MEERRSQRLISNPFRDRTEILFHSVIKLSSPTMARRQSTSETEKIETIFSFYLSTYCIK